MNRKQGIWLVLVLLLGACGGQEVLPTAVPVAVLPEMPPGAEGVIVLEEASGGEPVSATATPLPGNAPALPPLAGAPDRLAMGDRFSDPFANTRFMLNGALPTEPTQGVVMQQALRAPLTVAQARELTRRFGFDGELYVESYPVLEGVESELPPPTYTAFDGPRVFSVDPWSANYANQSADYQFDNGQTPQENAAVAEAFLQERGLLDFAYVVQPGVGSEVNFLRLIEERPLTQPEIVVGVAANGEVSFVIYQVLPNPEVVGSYPLISAEVAWQQLQASAERSAMPFIVTPANLQPPADGASARQSWQRQYEPGDAVQIAGWPAVYRPADGEGAPRIQLYPFVLAAEEQTLNEIAAALGQQVLVQGEMSGDGTAVAVQSWELFNDQEPVTVQGTVQRSGEQVLLNGTDGRSYLLPDAPADLGDGTELFVFAWTMQNDERGMPVLQWENLEQIGGDTAVAPESVPGLAAGGLANAAYSDVTIEAVTLVYYYSYQFPSDAAAEPTILLQPVWRFTGVTNTGEKVEFFVSAVL